MIQLTKKELLDLPFAIKSNHGITFKADADNSNRTVDLVANTYNYFDSYGDVLVEGCCQKSITERGPKSKQPGKIKHLSNHDLTKGIGRLDLLEEATINGQKVLHANSWMSETKDGEETLMKYVEGLIDQHSIGFRYTQLEWIDEEADDWDKYLEQLINPDAALDAGFMWIVKEIQLFEISSLDGFGANRLTPFLGVKSDNKQVQYNNFITKLDALHKAMKTGGDKDMIALQELQIKQMIYELYNPEPSPKDTVEKNSHQDGDTFDVSKAINNLSLKIN